MNYIECTVGVAMAAFLAIPEARGDEAPVTLPEIVVIATSTDVGYQTYDAAVARSMSRSSIYRSPSRSSPGRSWRISSP